MDQASSIDYYLHTHRDNADIVTMGKLAIAIAITQAERNSLMYVDINRIAATDYYSRVSKTYLHSLQMKLFDGYTLDEFDRAAINIKFIIFNYDRCIEQFLPFAISRFFICSFERASEIASRIQFIHPYGSLGPLRWQGGQHFDFGGDFNQPATTIAPRIRTFTEGVDEDGVIAPIRTAVDGSQTVIFLGFGYHDLNMNIFGQTVNVSEPKTVVGTALGMSKPNLSATYTRLNVFRARSDTRVELRDDLDCKSLIPEYDMSI